MVVIITAWLINSWITASSLQSLWALSMHCLSPPGFAKQILAVQGQWSGSICFSDRQIPQGPELEPGVSLPVSGVWAVGAQGPMLLSLPTMLEQSCLQATQAGQGESLPC